MSNFFNPVLPTQFLSEMNDEEIQEWEEKSRECIQIEDTDYFPEWMII